MLFFKHFRTISLSLIFFFFSVFYSFSEAEPSLLDVIQGGWTTNIGNSSETDILIKQNGQILICNDNYSVLADYVLLPQGIFLLKNVIRFPYNISNNNSSPPTIILYPDSPMDIKVIDINHLSIYILDCFKRSTFIRNAKAINKLSKIDTQQYLKYKK
jgi:hypothetical protein